MQPATESLGRCLSVSRPDHCLLLASASPRRRELLELLALPFVTARVDVDETPLEGEAPLDLVARLSAGKALAGAATVGPCSPGSADTPLIACDTVVVFEDATMGKPQDRAEAAAMLARLCGRDHTVLTAISVLDPRSGRLVTDVVRTDLRMRRYSDEEIAAYIATGDPLDKAGAYAIQHAQFDPVAEYTGCYANVVGLPLCHLARRLSEWALSVPLGLPERCQAHTGKVCTVFPHILCGE